MNTPNQLPVNKYTGKSLCDYPQCAVAIQISRRNTQLIWIAASSWIASIALAVWVNIREPALQALKAENLRLQSQNVYLQGRIRLEGVVSEITKTQIKEVVGAPVYSLPPGTNLPRQ